MFEALKKMFQPSPARVAEAVLRDAKAALASHTAQAAYHVGMTRVCRQVIADVEEQERQGAFLDPDVKPRRVAVQHDIMDTDRAPE